MSAYSKGYVDGQRLGHAVATGLPAHLGPKPRRFFLRRSSRRLYLRGFEQGRWWGEQLAATSIRMLAEGRRRPGPIDGADRLVLPFGPVAARSSDRAPILYPVADVGR